MVLRGNTIFWLTPHITVRNQLWVVIFLSIPFFTYTNALLHRKITCNFRKIMKLRKLMILVTHFYCFNFAEAKKKNHNSLASSEIILLTTSKSVIPIGFKHHPHCSVLIYITFCFPNLCLLCLDAKVSFKLVRQAHSAGDKANILISSVTDTFPTRKSSTEPKISHMLLYICICYQFCASRNTWKEYEEKGRVSGDTRTFDSMSQWLPAANHPGTGFSILTQTQTSCRPNRWSLTNTVPVFLFSKKILDQRRLQRE